MPAYQMVINIQTNQFIKMCSLINDLISSMLASPNPPTHVFDSSFDIWNFY